MDKKNSDNKQGKGKHKITKKFSQKMQANLLLVFCVIIIALIFMIGRIVYINSSNGDKYSKKVLAQQTYTSSEIPYKRGTIYDSKGTVLAFSDKAYNLILDVKYMSTGEEGEFIEPTITALLECYDFLTRDQLTQIVEENPQSQYIVLGRELSFEESQKLDDYIKNDKEQSVDGNSKVRGVYFEEVFVRTYPNNTLASSIMGFATDDGNGNWGLEQYYNEELSGSNGISYGYIDNELNLQTNVEKATNGNSLVTSLNSQVQRIVQDHILAFNEEFGSKNIGILIMNPNNGEIYAMASNEEYDLNNPADLSPFLEEATINEMTNEEKLDYLNTIWRNFVISDSFEPGSTFKPFTWVTALDEGLITPDQTFVCDGGELVGGLNIRCHKRTGHGTLTLTEALAQSCNDATMQIAKLIGRDLFYEYHTFFGFGSKTGIDMPGESTGIILPAENLNEVELATSSFGQTFTTTMLQMATGYSSIINGGNYYKPHIVKQILNDEGNIVEEIEPEILKKTTSTDTSAFLNQALYATVEDGTAQTAKVEGYQVAGKTGTAQKQPRSESTYVVSFLGHVPAENPEVVIYVVVDEAENVPSQADSSIATTLASDILSEVLPFLEIYPTEDLVIDEEVVNEDETATDEEGQGDTPQTEGDEAIETETAVDAGEGETEADSPDAIPDTVE